jgi:four helix bundle protein
MGVQAHVPIEELPFFKSYVALANWAWATALQWPWLTQDTVGKQLIRAVDRIGATLVEGDGRHSDREAAHLFTLARGSARETRHWILLGIDRNLIPTEEGQAKIALLEDATRQLNGIIRYRRASASRVAEATESYVITGERYTDPFTEFLLEA